LIFPEKPVYTYLGFKTPILSSMFATKRTHHIDEFFLVTYCIKNWNTIIQHLKYWSEILPHIFKERTFTFSE